IGVNAGIFGLINSLLLRPRAADRGDGRLVGVYSLERVNNGGYRAFSYPNYQDLRAARGPFTQLAAHNLAMAGVTEGETTRRAMVDIVSANYFDTLGVRLTLGRTFTPEEERPGSPASVAIASHGEWARTGYAADVLGRTVILNGRAYTLVGVAPRGFGGTTVVMEPDYYVPLSAHDVIEWELVAGTRKALDRRDYHRLLLIGRLRPGLTVDAADRELAPVAERLEEAFPAENARQQLLARPLSRLNISTSPSDDRQLYAPVALLQGLAGVVLLISCLNLANMMLAHGVARSREIAIRQAIGGGRGRIIRQLLTEGFLLAIGGGVAGLVAASAGSSLLLGSFARIAPIRLALETSPDVRVVGATVTFAAIATIIFGLWPALRLSRTDTVRALSDQTGGMGGGRRWFSTGNILVTMQMALSLALLIVSALFVRAALLGAKTDPGFAMNRTVHAEVDPALAGMDETRGREVHRQLLERLRSLPGVDAASSASLIPFGDISIGRMVQADGPRLKRTDPGARDRLVDAQYYVVGADYFRTLGIDVIAGREFTVAEERASSGVVSVIVDAPLARRLFPNENPVGRRLQFAADDDGAGSDRPLEIVGVVKGTRHDLFQREPEPHVYLPSGQAYVSTTHLHIRAAAGLVPADLLETIRRQIRDTAPTLPLFTVATLEAHRDNSIALWLLRTAARIFVVLGVAAAFLAIVGLYGVKSYIVSRRTREFGIRQALGATPAHLVRQVFREGLVLTAAGLAAGVGLGVLLGRALATLLYQVSPFDPASVAAASALLLASAAIAAWAPARRAGRIEPMVAMRTE
ncbi:MAG TPA: ADOP family duplicated permease, partial [Vicinamibacterales bacterium]|nr:ADOP family duplicated permease [Vicinamibacterales bacterium]